jgi:hypothetical protein
MSAKLCVPPATIVTGVVVMVTVMGVRGTVTVAVFDASDLLVAVIVADAVLTGSGAVNTPAEVMKPTVAVHVTPALAESLATDAVKVWVAPATIATGVVEMETLIAGAAAELPHPTIKANAAKPKRMREDRRMFNWKTPSNR